MKKLFGKTVFHSKLTILFSFVIASNHHHLKLLYDLLVEVSVPGSGKKSDTSSEIRPGRKLSSSDINYIYFAGF